MIPPLPVELLIKILDLATSPSYAVSARKEDRQLLRQCCLASKRLCVVAQPKLWSVFDAKRRGIAPLFEFPRLAQDVQVLDIVKFGNVSGAFGALIRAGETASSLVELEVMQAMFLEISLETFANLKHLTLVKVRMASFSSIILPNLVSLTVHYVHPLHADGDKLFPAASFPSLRAVYTTGGGTGAPPPPLGPVGLPLGQLDVFQVHASDYEFFSSDIQQRGSAVLLTFEAFMSSVVKDESRFAGFEHLLVEATGNAPNRTSSDLDSLDNLLRVRAKTKSLCLPSTLAPSASLSSDFSAARDAILDTCKTRKIDVVWRPFARAWEDDVGVSRDVWEYAKQARRKKKEETLELEMAGMGLTR